MDLTTNLDYILGNNPSVFVSEVADVNDDGNIDVTDISAIVNIILNGNSDISRDSNYDPFDWEYYSNKPIGDASLVLSKGRVYLENDKPVTSLQFSMDARVDYELLKDHSEGIIALSGCLGGEISQFLAPDGSVEEGNQEGERSFSKALEKARFYQSIFGENNFYIELHNHGIAQQKIILPDLLKISEEIGAPLVATNDSHYVNQDDASAHDALLCIAQKSTINNSQRFL